MMSHQKETNKQTHMYLRVKDEFTEKSSDAMFFKKLKQKKKTWRKNINK